VIVDLAGKGGKLRVAPMAAAIKASIDRWTRAAGISEGRVFRRLRKGDRVLDVGLDDQSVADVLQHATRPLAAAAADPAEAALWRGLAPHDCRRTYAKLTRKAEAPLEQIQLTLGHQSRMTTQKYLGTEVDYHDAPSDRLGLRLPGTIYHWNSALSNGEVLTHRRLGPSLAYETGTKPLQRKHFRR
jgi:integrase